jgi:hypothetical protein
VDNNKKITKKCAYSINSSALMVADAYSDETIFHHFVEVGHVTPPATPVKKIRIKTTHACTHTHKCTSHTHTHKRTSHTHTHTHQKIKEDQKEGRMKLV